MALYGESALKGIALTLPHIGNNFEVIRPGGEQAREGVPIGSLCACFNGAAWLGSGAYTVEEAIKEVHGDYLRSDEPISAHELFPRAAAYNQDFHIEALRRWSDLEGAHDLDDEPSPISLCIWLNDYGGVDREVLAEFCVKHGV